MCDVRRPVYVGSQHRFRFVFAAISDVVVDRARDDLLASVPWVLPMVISVYLVVVDFAQDDFAVSVPWEFPVYSNRLSQRHVVDVGFAVGDFEVWPIGSIRVILMSLVGWLGLVPLHLAAVCHMTALFQKKTIFQEESDLVDLVAFQMGPAVDCYSVVEMLAVVDSYQVDLVGFYHLWISQRNYAVAADPLD